MKEKPAAEAESDLGQETTRLRVRAEMSFSESAKRWNFSPKLMCCDHAHSVRVTGSVPSAQPTGVIGTHSLSLRSLLQIEQSVEDISEMFLRVDYVLDDVQAGDTTDDVVPVSSWDTHHQIFLRTAAKCRSILHNTVAIIDVCRPFLLIDIGSSSYDDANTGFKITEELVRTKVACGKGGSQDLSKLAQAIPKFGTHLAPTTSSSVSAPRASREVIPRISVHRLTAGIAFALRILLRYPWSYVANAPRRATSPNISCHTPPLVAEPDPSYPDTMIYDIKCTAAEIERFSLTWLEIANEMESWADYLAHRASFSDGTAYELGERDVTFCNAIAGIWDAIMDMRHASLVRMYAKKPADAQL
ncbi:uncharacterized protein TRAVEDRAFT_22585 [Trametes versicolor FP-101664 SS1]|uniref:uncharacterized protein n=1 Tax=Trametes versicolor (strain FP-101664) TaxID=717944 RepID=UPI0004621A29|nr:uncharacterized protein TRAVEDRAFT_22585 [Trametes versicolor FP-101664 SS1]EIW54658.1 hypothetical protein TRAVEDRAFT_22585 [Trametes versicolor FP-101664 SS1]